MHTTSVNKTWALITGASSGFGEEFARQYAEQGHSLVLVARRLDRLQALAETLRQQHRVEVVVEQVDLSDVAAIVRLQERLHERGIAIDILINNAGHGLQGPFADAPLDAVLAMVQLDVASLTAVTQVFARDMRKRRRGKILLVASMLAYQGVENFAVYSAAKAYVLRLGEALHRELKRDGITVTALCPGMSDTGFAKAAQQKLTARFEVFDDEASSRGAHWDSGLANGPHQRRPWLVEQALRDFYVGHTALAAPSRLLPHDEWMS
jgi:short-subunit dehydrogenase